MNSVIKRGLLTAAFLVFASGTAFAQSGAFQTTLFQLESVAGGLLADAHGRVIVFGNFPQGHPQFLDDVGNIDLNVENLICRSAGNPNQLDPLGDGFYGLYITTQEEPATRIHIFNTACGSGAFSTGVGFALYQLETGQTVDDIFSGPITVEIIREFDSDGDGTFDERQLVLTGTSE